jgi:hypothetical protein
LYPWPRLRIMRAMPKQLLARSLLVPLFALASCGGGDASIAPGPPTGGNSITYTPGVFAAASSFAARCETPRSGVNPDNGQRWPDVQGSLLAEKHFLRSWTNELYLWFDEVPDRDPAATPGTEAYFDLLKTPVVLPSGRPKDAFHYTWNTAEYQAAAATGTMLGYGISWDLVAAYPPRQLVVQYVQPGSAAANAGITRGAELLRADNYDVIQDSSAAGVAAINEAAFAPRQGSTHQFVFRDRGTTATRTVSLAAANVTFDAVPVVSVIPTVRGRVGYLLFNDHTASSESALLGAIESLRDAQVVDLVLDLRYNGGGYLDIASELAYMIAGPARTAGRTFIRTQFNSKHPDIDPVTQKRIVPMPFHDQAQGFSVGRGLALPSLGLPRVYVLTSDATCSASEAIINGLRGVGIAVYQFGGDTCGKPYGFYPQDNCGTTYFSIEFRGVNDLNFGDYAEGFSATRTSINPNALLPGCAARDDYSRDLGDVAEGQLGTALAYYQTGSCPAVPPASVQPQAAPGESGGVPLRQPVYPWRNNFILR